MKVRLENSFALPAAADAAWALLQDIEGVTGCMPGARITERIDDRHYKGTVAVRIGPAAMSFRGEVEVMALEAERKTLRLVGKGTDATGSSGAAMDLTARVEAVDAASCTLVGASEVSMSGKAAAFGARMMNSVAEQVFKQFAANFADRVQANPASPPSAAAGESAGTERAPAPAAGAAPAAAPAPEAKPLNALALAWAVIRDWLRVLFAAKKAR